jgi:hypothetical protein
MTDPSPHVGSADASRRSEGSIEIVSERAKMGTAYGEPIIEFALRLPSGTCLLLDYMDVRDWDSPQQTARLIQARKSAIQERLSEITEALISPSTREVVLALREVIKATQDYLPPDGISAQKCISRILAATDNPCIVRALVNLDEPRGLSAAEEPCCEDVNPNPDEATP